MAEPSPAPKRPVPLRGSTGTKGLIKVGYACNEHCSFCHTLDVRHIQGSTAEVDGKIRRAAALGYEVAADSLPDYGLDRTGFAPPAGINAARSDPFGPTRCSCPTKSSGSRGRNRSATISPNASVTCWP